MKIFIPIIPLVKVISINKVLLNPIFIFLVFSSILSPLLSRIYHSSAIGLLTSSLIISIVFLGSIFSNRLPIKKFSKYCSFVIGLIFLILLHGLILSTILGYELHSSRLFLSSIIALLVFIAAYIFIIFFSKTTNNKMILIMNWFWVITILLSATVFIRFSLYSPFNTFEGGSNSLIDSLSVFSEPSHFFITFAPIYLYKVITSKGYYCLLLIILGFGYAYLLASLTMNIIVSSAILFEIFSLLFYGKFKKYQVFYKIIIVIGLLFIGINFLSISSIYNQLVMTGLNSNNNSILTILADWHEAYLNTIKTSGFGIGFQQLGFVGERSFIKDIIYETSGAFKWDIKLESFIIAPKLISEFGFFSLLFFILYIITFIKNLWYVLKSCTLPSHKINHKSVLMACFILSFSINLFVRGTGYFTPSTFFLICAGAYFYYPIKGHKLSK